MNFRATVTGRREFDNKVSISVEVQSPNDKWPRRYDLDFKPENAPRISDGEEIDVVVPDFIDRIRTRAWIGKDGDGNQKAYSRMSIWEPKVSQPGASEPDAGDAIGDDDIPF